MIVKDALRSLRDSRSKAVFYWLTFYLTSALMFLFFNMAESATQGATEIYLNNNLADLTLYLTQGNMGNLMMVFVVIMCSIDLVYANDFYVKNKTKELAIRMISGATFTQLAAYLLIQTLLLLAIAIPLGIVTGLLLIPVFNGILASTGSQLFISVQSYGLLQYFSVTGFIVALTTVLNMSFAYKSTAVLMLNGNIESMNTSGRTFTSLKSKTMDIVVNIICLILYIIPVFMFYNGSEGLALYALIGCAGLEKVITGILLPAITKWIRHSKMRSTANTLALGYIRKDILVTRSTIYLYFIDIIILLSMMFSRSTEPLERLLVLTSYVVMAALQAMAMMFRLETELSGRHGDYVIMNQTGVSEKIRRSTAGREITGYYLFVIVVVFLYMVNIMISLVRSTKITSAYAGGMLAVALCPLVLMYLLTLAYYRNIIQVDKK